jgi:hypothetical protein
LLSGVVVDFDKFNPKVGKPVGVPLAGNVMASRWAFEAFMVTQFKDNPFEEDFYPLDKRIRESEYKQIYYIPTLETKLSYCLNNKALWRSANATEMTNTLEILRNEIKNELKFIGDEKFPQVDRLAIGTVDSALLMRTGDFLDQLKTYYGNRGGNASREREALIAKMTSTPAGADDYDARRNRYVNKTVKEWVEKTTSVERIVEDKGRLVQRVYPIYLDEHKPSHWFDFSANLYQPTKHLVGRNIDTLYFNIAVMWCMTAFMFVTLYLDALRRLIKRLEATRRYRAVDR